MAKLNLKCLFPFTAIHGPCFSMLEIGEILTRLGSQNSIEANPPDQVNWQFPLFLKFLEQKRMVRSIWQ